MTRLDELLQTLETHAALAPDSAGVLDSARTGAARIHRRRRLTAIVAAATAVVLAAVVIPVTLHLEAAPITPAKPPAPKPWETTLSLDPSYPGTVVRQQPSMMTVQLPGGEHTYGIDVFIERGEPGQDLRLFHGEPVTVQGQPGQFTLEFKPNPKTSPGGSVPTMVAWTDPTGVIIEIRAGYWGVDRAAVMALAEAVRVGPPHAIMTPFQLGLLPAGLTVDWVMSYPRLDDPHRQDVAEVRLSSPGNAAKLTVRAKTHVTDGMITGAKPAPDMAGHRVWYWSEAALVVQVGACMYEFSTNAGQLTLDQLRGIAAGTTYADCTDTSTWTPPVP